MLHNGYTFLVLEWKSAHLNSHWHSLASRHSELAHLGHDICLVDVFVHLFIFSNCGNWDHSGWKVHGIVNESVQTSIAQFLTDPMLESWNWEPWSKEAVNIEFLVEFANDVRLLELICCQVAPKLVRLASLRK